MVATEGNFVLKFARSEYIHTIVLFRSHQTQAFIGNNVRTVTTQDEIYYVVDETTDKVNSALLFLTQLDRLLHGRLLGRLRVGLRAGLQAGGAGRHGRRGRQRGLRGRHQVQHLVHRGDAHLLQLGVDVLGEWEEELRP